MFVIAFLLFYSSANLYLFYRFTSVFSVPKIFVACIWLFLALASIIFRNDSTFLPNDFTDILYLLGAYWITVIYYAAFFTLFCDIIRKIKPLPLSGKIVGAFICLLTITLVSYGAINAKDIVIKNYDITIDKKISQDHMRIVFLSDLHLGKVYSQNSVQEVVDKINKLKPYLVVISGDIIDSDFNSVYRQNALQPIKNINSTYGVYAVMGNHEYIGGQEREVIEYFTKSGINVLIETGVKLPNGLLLFGKDDYSKNKSIDAAFDFVQNNKESPVVLISHQPRNIENFSKLNVDLFLAGHTHLGQNYPNNYIVQNMYSLAYGYKTFGNLKAIVTSGIGTWGPPVRVGTQAEIVCIDIKFKEKT